MALFSRSKKTTNASIDDDLFDATDIGSSKDNTENLFDSDGESNNESILSAKAYGIEDAIALMRCLPNGKADIVVTVVKKTLESTNISVADIIDDAASKENRLQDRHDNLKHEIKELQEQINRKEQNISQLLEDLAETTHVKERLLHAIDLESKDASVKTTRRTASTRNSQPTTKKALSSEELELPFTEEEAPETISSSAAPKEITRSRRKRTVNEPIPQDPTLNLSE